LYPPSKGPISRIGDIGLVLVTGVEFAPDQRKAGHARRFDLVMYFIYCATDHAIPRNVFLRSENVFRRIVGIDVGGDIVERDCFSAQCLMNASTQAACAVAGPPDAESLIHLLNCDGRVVVKLQ